MLRNYLNITLRNLQKKPVFNLINVCGLALGIACLFVVTLYIRHEMSYDTFHDQATDLYRITWNNNNPQTRTPHPMAQALVNDFPEVQSAVSLTPLWGAGLTRETHSLLNPLDGARYDEKNIIVVDTTFFDVFSFSILHGDKSNALKKANGVLLSESMARKYFGTDDAVGKQLLVDDDSNFLEVTAVFEDVPDNSHFHFDFLISYVREKQFDPANPFFSWEDFGHYNYIRVVPGSDVKALEAKLLGWSKKYFDWSPQDYQYLEANNYGFVLQPITDIHLHSRLRWELEPNGNIDYIYLLGTAAILTLIIACVNFMNLTTAIFAERAKEAGVRKTLGAKRNQITLQFMSQTIVMSVVAGALGILLTEITLPILSTIAGFTFEISYGTYALPLIGLAVALGAAAGIYPSIVFSAIRPQLVLKGKFTHSKQGSSFQKLLVGFQFAISMALISAVAVILHQLDFIQNRNLGFDKTETILIPIKKSDGFPAFEPLKNELAKIAGVSHVSASSNIPGMQFNQHTLSPRLQPDHDVDASEAFVDYEFFETLGISLAEGKLFTRPTMKDTVRSMIINETAARELFLGESAVGKEVLWDFDDREIRATVIGVVKDFNFQSLHDVIRPLIFLQTKQSFNYLVIKVSTDEFDRTVAAIEKVYKQFEPTFGFEFSFLDDQLDRQYVAEKQTASILLIFSIIAVGIACLGLFAISMLTFHHRVKEVGIRKVLGASTFNLVQLLVGSFTKLVIIAIVIAIPFSWMTMRQWLSNFAYQVSIDPTIFIISGGVLILVSWLTLAYFTVKAAQLNPSDTLKGD